MKKKSLPFVLFFFNCLLILYGQTYINQDWVTCSAQPDSTNFPIVGWAEVNWSKSTVDYANNVIVTGNTLIGQGNTEIITIKYNAQGDMVWQQTYGGQANSYDYGVAVETDNAGNVYVVGAVAQNLGLLDICVLKYSALGTLQWTKNWDGVNGLHDIPSQLKIDNQGNVYLTGGTQTMLNNSDLVTIKYQSNGVLVWEKTFDYNGLYDFPTDLQIGETSGETIVSAFSSIQGGGVNYTTIKYESNSGNQLDQIITPVLGLTIGDNVVFTHDINGNFYVSGSTVTPGNKDIQVIKIDNTGEIEWVNTFDFGGLDDIPNSIEADAYGNVFVSATISKLNGGSDIMTFKLDSSGAIEWEHNFSSKYENHIAKSVALNISAEGEIYVLGEIHNDSQADFVVVKYGSGGVFQTSLHYDNEGNNEHPTNLLLANNKDFFVTGISKNAIGNAKYITIKYSEFDKGLTTVPANDTIPRHVAQDVIIKFDPKVVNTDFVDKKGKRFTTDLAEVISVDVINKMSDKLRCDLSRGTALFKIFTRLTTADSVSLNRLNETIVMSDLWSTFIMRLPDTLDLQEAIDSLSTLTECIKYAHHNFLGELYSVPNDIYYNAHQVALYPSPTYPDAHINMEEAWDIEVGQSHTKVGVIERMVKWTHEDFGDGTWEGSNFDGGWNFWNNHHASEQTIFGKHAVSVAGQIFALRNNETGIAGIAGGDVHEQENTGVQRFTLGIDQEPPEGGPTDMPVSIWADAVVEGSAYNPDTGYGYGLHIMNHSYGYRIDEDYWSPNHVFEDEDADLINEAFFSAFRNQCINVASRGNFGTDEPTFPASVNDPWVVAVGASGVNGEYLTPSNHGPLGIDYTSAYGQDVDVVAPGTGTLMLTTTASERMANEAFWICDPLVVSDIDYECAGGTSSSSAITSGVVALMYSRHHINKGYPNNLAPEDVEFLLQEYATEIGQPNYSNGYDVFNGHGRVDAGTTLKIIDLPSYYVLHLGDAPATSTVIEGNLQQITLGEGFGSLSPGTYNAKKITMANTYVEVFDSGWTVLDGWGRVSAAVGTSESVPPNYNHWAEYDFDINGNTATITATTHTWLIVSSITGQQINQEIPFQSEDLKTPFSLHLCNPVLSGIDEEEGNINIKLFPNPASAYARIDYDLPSGTNNIIIQVVDMNGQVMFEQKKDETHKSSIIIDLKTFGGGVYVCRILTNRGHYSKKMVKL